MNRNRRLHMTISLAQSELEIVRLMIEQTAALLPSELVHLPPECHVTSLNSGEDVGVAAVALVQRELIGNASDEAGALVLRRVMETFVAAQDRLREIRSRCTDSAAA